MTREGKISGAAAAAAAAAAALPEGHSGKLIRNDAISNQVHDVERGVNIVPPTGQRL
jgi:hypothetical protein